MDEGTSCIYVPMWAIGLGLLILNFIGCSHTQYPDIPTHSCPEYGHGDCPICCDPYRHEEIITLDN
jgi:hypothetical protein